MQAHWGRITLGQDCRGHTALGIHHRKEEKRGINAPGGRHRLKEQGGPKTPLTHSASRMGTLAFWGATLCVWVRIPRGESLRSHVEKALMRGD